MQNIAMFGGTFNPIHNGHIELALSFARSLKLDKVLLIPTHTPPHKQFQEEVTAQQRWEMCALAAEDHPELEASDLEISRPGASYTVDTLRELQKAYPQATLYLITGADMFLTVQQWRAAQQIFRLAVICGVPRDQKNIGALREHAGFLQTSYHARTQLLDMPLLPISSTEIRNRIQKGDSIQGLVPENVEQYIREHRLYQ